MTSILIVDDEPGIREVFQSILEEEGYDVTTAVDFFEAESALAAHSYDVVVTDIIMPRVNGLTLLRRVREIDASIPVIMITGEPDVDTATDAVRHGAYDYISKPITLDTLTRTVARAVERKQLLDEKRRLEVENLAYQSDLERKVAERATELEQRHQELATLIEISRAMSATLDPVKVMEIVAENVVTRLGYKAALVSFYAEEDDTFTMGAVYPRDALLKRAIELIGYEPWKLKFSFDPQMNPGFEQLLRGQVWLATSFHDFVRPVLSKRVADAMQRLYGTRYNVKVPMWVRGKLVGTIMAGRKDEIDAQAQKVLASLARQAALAVENGRLFEAERAQLLLAQTLQEVGALLTASLSLDEVCQHVFDLLSRVIKYDSVSLQLLGQDNQLSLLVARGFSDPELFSQVARELSDYILDSFAERKVIVIPDTHKDSRWIVVPEVDYIRSWVGAPLLVKGRLIGVLNVDSATVNAYDAALGETVMAFANQAAIAIENARLFDEEMSSRRLADTLRQVAQALNSTLSLDDVLGLILTELEKVIPLDSGSIMLLEGKDLIVRAAKGFADRDSVLKVRLDLDTALLNREVVESKRPLIVGSVHEDKRWIDAMKLSGLEPELHATCSWMGIPLNVKGQVIGMLTTDKHEAHFYSERDAQVALTFANQAAIAIENARLFEETKRRLAEARLIQEVMLAAASTLDFDLVLERVVKALNRALGIFHLGFLVPNERNDALVSHPFLADFEEEAFQVSIEGSLLGQAYRTGLPVLVRDMAQESACQEIAPDVCFTLAVPVRVGDRVAAVLYAQGPQAGAFDEDELRLFTTIAGQLGVTLENARLYQRLEVQAAELSQAYSELQEINRLRIELVQNVSHELRTPLGLIKGYAALLLDGDLGTILDNQRMALQIIHDRTKTLTRLIHNLTMLQALPQEALALAPLSLVEVARHALVEFRSRAKKTDITFLDELPEELPPVLGNQEQLGLAFGHLLDNAVKFSPDGGTVTLRAWADQDMVRLLVADEGIGISSEHLNRVFERFYQVDGSASRRFGGMGVGLALVWEIIEAHGGTVNVESDVGKGSQFIVALPQATGS